MVDRYTTPFDDEPISPELVLVDPELAARVRAHAVAGPTLRAALEPSRAAVAAEARAAAHPPPQATTATVVGPTARRRRRAYAGYALAALALVGLLGVGFAGPRDAPSLGEPAPRAAASITLTWGPLASADYYLVEIFSSLRLVHGESVRANRLGVPAWLPTGRYTWSVRAGTGPPVDRATGEPFERGWFTITK